MGPTPYSFLATLQFKHTTQMHEKIKEYYKRKLPHIQPFGASFFVTFRLYDSIPKTALDDMETNKRAISCLF